MIDKRNVVDFYKYWTDDAIRADLDEKRHNFSVLVTNFIRDFNLSTVIRCSNAFLAKNVIIYGSKQYDRRGTIGTHHYTNFKHVKEIESLDGILEDSVMIGINNLENSIPIEDYKWDYNKHIIMAFGEESVGLRPEVIERCSEILYIKQYGTVRSLNVGCASAIAMFSYMQKKG